MVTMTDQGSHGERDVAEGGWPRPLPGRWGSLRLQTLIALAILSLLGLIVLVADPPEPRVLAERTLAVGGGSVVSQLLACPTDIDKRPHAQLHLRSSAGVDVRVDGNVLFIDGAGRTVDEASFGVMLHPHNFVDLDLVGPTPAVACRLQTLKAVAR